ncbi:hypothetical protein EJ03DRAFT_280952 [Teratosphaeria nubilosa]|uniref:Amino acid transporter transmembrane domain-containing protein n=1 Tax=Teratosphaeria nubilosa TaxID=161662 RepID=A0A6G1KWM1_9PEZI|nr:hypothetical protein EJ03DRAFT_280952 [Teratosphaeria nubilosa]
MVNSDTASHTSPPSASTIVNRHLPPGYSADPSIPTDEDSLTLQGGDMHRDIFKIKARASAPRRAATFTASRPESSMTEQQEPGGLRREYIRRQRNIAAPVTRNFVSFLELYGSFAGEDLNDTDEEEEEQPLLQPSRKRIKPGDASQTKTFFTLLKAFIGTGILFLPKAFRNGGLLFSSCTLIAVSIITTICFRLLLQCREKFGGGGYGELGEAIFGRRMRSIILGSIIFSQLGFVSAGIVFTAENLLSFVNAVSNASLGVDSLIAIQFIILIPLALIRKISKLGPAAILADAFILIGLIYIWYYDITTLYTSNIAPSVVLFNPSSFTLTVGAAIFTFEGIGLILPIQSSMKQPEKFPKLLYIVMLIITVIFTSVGALCYATFGDETKIQIISNFPQSNKLVNAVQFLYSLAVLVGEPVQLFPAVRIIETSLFGEKATGKKSATIKWEKNALRTGMMIGCGVVAVVGASDLDKFVALIGSVACVPLVYIYPPWLHLKGVANNWGEKAFDITLIVLGVIAMFYTGIVTISQWVSG